ncbi:MAG: response regulator [Bryobacteraceae bacterium]|jgi:PAS domain S-box-containing protein
MCESDRHFRTIGDVAPVMLCAAGADKRCTFFNRRWLAFTGRTLAEQLASGWTGSVHPDDLKRCTTIYSESFDRRVEFTVEFRVRRSDREYRSILATGAPHYSNGGVFVGYVICCVDVTEIRLEQDEASVHNQPTAIGEAHAGSVLFVDDEDGLRLAVSNLLRRKGFHVMEAPCGSVAIEMFRKNRDSIDAILLDLTLPGMSCRKVIVESARVRPDAKIVLTSAYGRERAEAELEMPQVKAFIQKPYKIEELVRVLFDVMSPAAAIVGAPGRL